ncbi:MAG: tetratricopeptide repeat protein [Myxococcaceae bacterium]
MSRSLWTAAAVSVLMSGCFYPADRGRALEARVDRLQGENEALRGELEKSQEDLKAALPRIDEKVAEVTKALESLDKASRRTDADTGVLLGKMVEDVASLRGQLETYVYQLNEMQTKLATVQEETEKRIVALQGPEAVKAAEARKKLDEVERPTDPKAFLALAVSKVKDGELVVARKLYDEFFKNWPKNALRGEAHFGMGEAWYAENKCREALFEYGKVIQEYAKTKSAPDALLRSADCFSKLKMNAEAKLALEEVVKSHPKSAAATTAKARLAELEKGAKKAAPKKKGR